MQATSFEYRFRFWIRALIYALGFVAPWTFWNAAGTASASSNEPAWLSLSTLLFRQGWLTYNAAVTALLVMAVLFTGVGAWLRTWGAAYQGVSGWQAGAATADHTLGQTMLADGPFRHTRNPLYLGTILHTCGVALLMPPSGAVFAIVLLWIFEVRLALSEEPTLAVRLGPPYLDYKARVPRFLPTPKPQVPAAGAAPHWGQAVLAEVFVIGVFLTLAIFGWSFDRTMLRQGILVSLGAALVARAFLPLATPESVGQKA